MAKDLAAAISEVARSAPSRDQLSQFLRNPGATDDSLDQIYRALIRSEDYAVIDRGYVTVHRQPVSQLNGAAITYALCRRASEVGAQPALDELAAKLRTTSIRCHSSVIAGGPTPEVTTEIGDGVSLIPFRQATDDPTWQSRLQVLAPDKNFIEACAPSCLWSKEVSAPFAVQSEAPLGWQGYPGLLQHLPWGPFTATHEPSLQLTALQSYVPPAYPIAHFIQPIEEIFFAGFTYISVFAPNHISQPRLVDQSMLDDLHMLNISLMTMRQQHPEDAERFHQCLRRLHRVFFAGLLDDQAVEARIALEMTFTSNGYQTDPKSRVAGNSKLYIGNVDDPRGRKYRPTEIYDALSKPVHGLEAVSLDNSLTAVGGAVKLTTLALRKTLQLGRQPNWESLRVEARHRSRGPKDE
jgi:hypothetical protein